MILGVLQARMSSTRLPGKVLRPLAGAPMILRQIERLDRCERIDRLIVATSTDRSDDVLAEILEHNDIEVFRGPLEDVLARFAAAAAMAPEATHVVRLTADCPLADPEVIDAVIDLAVESGADYASNVHAQRPWPKGLDAEVMTVAALLEADREASAPDEREHVTAFIYRRPERFRLAQLTADQDEGEVRWTVDRPDDLAFVSEVYDALYPADPEFNSDDVRVLVRCRPDLAMAGGDRRV